MEATQRMLRYCRELLRVGGTLRVEYSLLLLKMTAINIFAVHHAADTYAGESTLVSNLALVLSRVVSPRGLTTKQSRLPVTSMAPVQTQLLYRMLSPREPHPGQSKPLPQVMSVVTSAGSAYTLLARHFQVRWIFLDERNIS